MSVDLWTMGNVAIHLRQGYGGQDVKMLPMPIFNLEWERVVGVVFRCRCRADIYSSFLPLPLPLSSTSISDLKLSLSLSLSLFTFTFSLHVKLTIGNIYNVSNDFGSRRNGTIPMNVMPQDAVVDASVTGAKSITVKADWVKTELEQRFGFGKKEAFIAKFGDDFAAALTKKTGKRDADGNELLVWHDYVAGTDPTDINSTFKAIIDMQDGKPVISWEPDLNSDGEERVYTVHGKENLSDIWHSPITSFDHFFKVDVAIPLEGTVTFNVGGGSSVNPISVRVGRPIGELPMPTRDEYTFLGWFTAAEGGIAVTPETVVTADMTIYARWQETHAKVQLWEGGPYWATTNVGAEKPEDYGYYFWWGDTVGYKRENNKWVASNVSNSNFSFGSGNTPTCNKSISTLQSEGWITSDGVLTPEHDAAHAHWGGDWRMPTYQELVDLCDMCDWIRTKMNGVYGYVVRGRGEYTSNSIFLPCVGNGNGTSFNDSSSYGSYWSSELGTDGNCAGGIDFGYGDTYHEPYYDDLYYGHSVRPVQGGSK